MPVIETVSAIQAQQAQTITITGSGFGTQAAYNGDSPYIDLLDQSGSSWNAGYVKSAAGAEDAVTLSISSWTDTQIVLSGFLGAYGSNGGTLSLGDQLSLSVWNVQAGAGPGICSNIVVGAGATNCNGSATTTSLTASPNPAAFGVAVTFTASVGSSTGAPAGSVSFYDGTDLLGAGTLASGVATYFTSALSVGAHNIRAIYTGGTTFDASASNVVVETITPVDFSISAAPASQTLYTGETASYTVTITPGTGFTPPVALTCSQLPVNTTCTFSPATVTGGSGSSKLTVQTAAPSQAAAAGPFPLRCSHC